MGQLTVAKIRRAAPPGRYADGGTLYLYIAPGGSKSWVQRITVKGRRRDLGLGPWPAVSLAEARTRALANRVLVERGSDPHASKRKAVPTFREAAYGWEAGIAVDDALRELLAMNLSAGQ